MKNDSGRLDSEYWTCSGPLERPLVDGSGVEEKSLLAMIEDHTRKSRDRIRPPAPEVLTDPLVDHINAVNGHHQPAYDRMMIRFGGKGF